MRAWCVEEGEPLCPDSQPSVPLALSGIHRLARLHSHEHQHGGSVADHLSTNAAIELRTAKLARDAEVYKVMSRGMKVIHPRRGPGVVIAIEPDDVREKPLHVEYEDGQVHNPRPARHSAALHSAARLGRVRSPRLLGSIGEAHYGLDWGWRA